VRRNLSREIEPAGSGGKMTGYGIISGDERIGCRIPREDLTLKFLSRN
jgi:hypothetical protein